jgi:O-antigen/teichoic acid export membrane protein
MSILKKLAGETAIYGLSSIVGRFLNYLLVPLYTGIFKPGEYGVSTLFYAYASFLGVIFTYGMETAFFRFYQKHEPREQVFSTAFSLLSITSILFGTLIALFSEQIAIFSDNIGRENLFIYLGVILAADAISALPFALLRQQGQAKKFAFLRLLNIATNIGLNLFFYKILDCKSISYMFLANLVSSLIVLPFFVKEIRLLKFGINISLWKEMFTYAFPVIFMGLAGMVNETIDRILLKKLIINQANAEYQIGVYGANYKLAILITLFIQAFRFAAEPFFFARMKDDDAKVSYAKVMNYFVIVCSIIFLFVLFYLDILKYFIRKKEYWEGLSVVPILLFANIFLGIFYNLSIWYKLTNKTQLGAYVSLVGAAITLILNYLWIPKYGYMGSAWATLFCYGSMVVISYFQGKKHYPVPYQIAKISVYMFSALLLYFFSLYTTNIISNIYLKLGFNTLLLLSYIVAVIFLEMKGLKKLIQMKQQVN